MRKIVIGIVSVCVLCLAVFIGVKWKWEANTPLVQTMKQNCAAVMPYVFVSGDTREDKLAYRGVVTKADSPHVGLTRLSDGCFSYYCDSDTGELRKIEIRRNMDTRVPEFTKRQILETAEQLCAEMLGEDMLAACRQEVIYSQDDTYYTVEYYYPNGDQEYLAASATYLKQKGMISAFFQDRDALVTGTGLISSGEITREEALARAKEEAVAFIAKKYPDTVSRYVLEEDRIEYQKLYSSQKKCMVWAVQICYREEGNEIPFYFTILVDIYTGEIVQNANNYT